MTESAIVKTVGDIELSAELKEINETAKEVIAAASSPSTRRAYAAQWRNFTAFCERYGLEPLPAKPETVAGYIAYCVKADKSASNINQAIAAIRAAHKRAGLDNPTESELVKVAAAGARRTVGTAPHKKAAATEDIIGELVDGLDRTTVQGKRDAALILLGFWGAFRRSELVGLDVEDIERAIENGKPALRVTIRRSKTDQEGRGMVKAITTPRKKGLNPIAALNDYLDAAGIASGPVFRRVRRGDHVQDERLTGRAVALIVQHAAAESGIVLDLAGHSLRSGFITSALAAGISERAVMNQSGHRSVTVMRGYEQRATAFQDNAAVELAKKI